MRVACGGQTLDRNAFFINLIYDPVIKFVSALRPQTEYRKKQRRNEEKYEKKLYQK